MPNDQTDQSLEELTSPTLSKEEKLAFATRFSSDLFAYINNRGEVELFNKAFKRELGADHDDLEGIPIADLFKRTEFGQIFTLHFAECLEGKQTFTEYHHVGQKGIDKHFGIQFIPYFSGNLVTSALVLFRDISYVRRLEDKVQFLEYHDRRTGLPNRRSLDLVLEKELAKGRRKDVDRRLAVLFISLENFARVNQTYGHEVGDILLENSGLRIKETLISELLRDSDYVFESAEKENEQVKVDSPELPETKQLFRFEGKEFAAVLPDITRETDAALVASRITKNVSLPYHDKFGSEIFIKCHVGISVYPNDGVDKDTLVQQAASAMHEARRRKMDFLLFNPELHDRALEKMRLGGSIYNAFIESQFELYFQPVVDYLGEIVGAEALIRWNHPERGIVQPAEFLPLAEEKGIIVNIGKWVLYSVVKQLESWPNDIYVALNLSSRELEQPQTVDNIIRAIQGAKDLDARQLKIEISETDSMKDPEKNMPKMLKLADKGIDIQVGDFGTGHSSLSHLKNLPARSLKIDRSFVTDIVHNSEDRKFLESIIELAYSRKKTVIVQGVESVEQVELIRQMKPVFMQGYYFSGPVPAEVFERFINRRIRLPIS
ncbi:MAG: EAL domain-containing protein [Spirochaetales bacterium]|jgi:diguanylate cyclase|nr:EAL domain-containing protein [Spirochaetales bacterium]